MPIKGARYRFKQVNPTTRVRLAYVGPKPVEVTTYKKRNGTWVQRHTRRKPKR